MTTLLDRTFLGIEFKDDSIVLAFLRNSLSGMSLVSSETFPLKEGVETANEISDYIRGQGVEINRVFVSIPDKWAITKFTDIPSIKGRSKSVISNLMKFEIERHIPFPIENVSYDFLVLQKKEKVFSVVFVAVLNEKIAYVKNLLEKLALVPHAITLSSFAVLSAIESSGVPAGGLQEVIGITRRSDIFADKDETTILLYLNGRNATLSVIMEGLCVQQRTIPLDPDQKTDVSADKIVQLLSEMKDKQLPGRSDKLLVAGDISSFKGIVDRLEEAMAAGDIATKVSEFRGDVQGQEMNALVSSVGACFTGLGIGSHRINILPHKKEYDIRKVAPLATKVFILLIAIMLAGMFVVGAVKQKNYLVGLEAALKENEPAVKELEKVILDINLLKKQSGVIYNVIDNEITLEMLAELTAVLPRDAWITNLHYKGFDIKGKRKAGGEMLISGLAASSSVLIPLLEDSEYFEKVEFVGPIKKKGMKEQFKIKVEVLRPHAGESE